jgi:hypothetical protein
LLHRLSVESADNLNFLSLHLLLMIHKVLNRLLKLLRRFTLLMLSTIFTSLGITLQTVNGLVEVPKLVAREMLVVVHR